MEWKEYAPCQKSLEDIFLELTENVQPVERQIDNISDLADYGLMLPSQTITVGTGTEEFTINVGDYNSLTDTYYVALPGENRAYVVDPYTIERYQVTLEDLIEETETEEESYDETIDEIIDEIEKITDNLGDID